MERYFICEDDKVVKMGEILRVGGVGMNSIQTGDYKYNMVALKTYPDREKANEILKQLTDIIMHPTVIEKGQGEQWIII